MSESARIVFAVACGLGAGALIAFLLIRFTPKTHPYGNPEQLGWPVVQNAEEVTPIMDGYRMKCCDCGLVHRLRFRAIEVKERYADGTFRYDELDPERFRVELTAWREEEEEANHAR